LTERSEHAVAQRAEHRAVRLEQRRQPAARPWANRDRSQTARVRCPRLEIAPERAHAVYEDLRPS
jgi:hypothetical protein